MNDILERVAKIDKQIAWYQARREAVLREDAEYANYLDRYEAMYRGEPLPIQGYYKCLDELDDLYKYSNSSWNPPRMKRIEELEQRLAI